MYVIIIMYVIVYVCMYVYNNVCIAMNCRTLNVRGHEFFAIFAAHARQRKTFDKKYCNLSSLTMS